MIFVENDTNSLWKSTGMLYHIYSNSLNFKSFEFSSWIIQMIIHQYYSDKTWMIKMTSKSIEC